jgi:hypothetical protein
MRKLMFVVAVLMVLGLARPAMAQDENALSVYGGYYFVRANVNVSGEGTTTDDGRIIPAVSGGDSRNFGFNFNGGGGQFAYNFNQDQKLKFGVVADFAGYSTSSFDTSATVFTYLFGPRVSYGDGRFTPFVQSLYGGARGSGAFGGEGGSRNVFAMTVGGGLDFQVNKHFFVRPVQAEYMLTKFNTGSNDHQNNFRFSAALGFRWP